MTHTAPQPKAALIALLGFLIVPASANAQQEYNLRFDCWGAAGMDNEGTQNEITVRLYDQSRQLLRVGYGNQQVQGYDPNVEYTEWEGQITNSDCGPGFLEHPTAIIHDYYGLTLEIDTWNVIGYVTIQTSGEDAFWLDQLNLEGLGYTESYSAHWGRNEGYGYCLSTDPTDADRSWKDVVGRRGCKPCFEFRVSDGQVYDCPSHR